MNNLKGNSLGNKANDEYQKAIRAGAVRVH